jgi:ketosteroid isomerase-like protein
VADSSLDVTRAFIEAINRGDVAALLALMSEDHTFTDSLGRSFSGAEQMVAGWRYFLDAYPGYWIRVDAAMADGARVALFGEAGGGWKSDGRVLAAKWSARAAWLAQIEGGRVKAWSVFCDTGWAKPPGQD